MTGKNQCWKRVFGTFLALIFYQSTLTVFLLGTVICQSQGWKRPKNRFSSRFSEDMHIRKFFLTKYTLYTYTQILSDAIGILKNLFCSRRLTVQCTVHFEKLNYTWTECPMTFFLRNSLASNMNGMSYRGLNPFCLIRLPDSSLSSSFGALGR